MKSALPSRLSLLNFSNTIRCCHTAGFRLLPLSLQTPLRPRKARTLPSPQNTQNLRAWAGVGEDSDSICSPATAQSRPWHLQGFRELETAIYPHCPVLLVLCSEESCLLARDTTYPHLLPGCASRRTAATTASCVLSSFTAVQDGHICQGILHKLSSSESPTSPTQVPLYSLQRGEHPSFLAFIIIHMPLYHMHVHTDTAPIRVIPLHLNCFLFTELPPGTPPHLTPKKIPNRDTML